MARNPAREACVTFCACNWATVGPKGRMSGQPICSGMPSCATSSHFTDLFAVGPSELLVIVHLTRVNRSIWRGAWAANPARPVPGQITDALCLPTMHIGGDRDADPLRRQAG